MMSVTALGNALLLDEAFIDAIIFNTLLEVEANPPNSLLITPPAAPGDPLGIGITITADPDSSIVVTAPTALNPGVWEIGDTLNPGTFATTFQLDWKSTDVVLGGPPTSLLVPITFSKLNKTVTVTVGNNGGTLDQTAFPVNTFGPLVTPANVTIDSFNNPVPFPVATATANWSPDPTVNITSPFASDAGMQTITPEDQNVYQGGAAGSSSLAQVNFQTDPTNLTFALQWVPTDTFNDIVWNAVNATLLPTDLWKMPQFTFQYTCLV
jgi:hypothetical protein